MNPYTPIQSGDGSKTLYSEQYDEHYHSLKDGAYRESLLKHVQPAYELLIAKKPKQIVILDICFGLGYNSLTTLEYLKTQNYSGKIIIHSPELDESLLQALDRFEYPEVFDSWKPVIQRVSEKYAFQNEQIDLQVHAMDAREQIRRSDSLYDIVYLDPFSPKKNPLLWTQEYFVDLKAHLNPDGMMTTYSQASSIRMGLHNVGFKIYDHPIENLRNGTLISLVAREGFKEIDMILKKERNPSLKPLFDKDFM